MWTNVYEWIMKKTEADRQLVDKVSRKSNIGSGDNIMLFMKYLKLKDKTGKIQS